MIEGDHFVELFAFAFLKKKNQPNPPISYSKNKQSNNKITTSPPPRKKKKKKKKRKKKERKSPR